MKDDDSLLFVLSGVWGIHKMKFVSRKQKKKSAKYSVIYRINRSNTLDTQHRFLHLYNNKRRFHTLLHRLRFSHSLHLNHNRNHNHNRNINYNRNINHNINQFLLHLHLSPPINIIHNIHLLLNNLNNPVNVFKSLPIQIHSLVLQ